MHLNSNIVPLGSIEEEILFKYALLTFIFSPSNKRLKENTKLINTETIKIQPILFLPDKMLHQVL